MVQLVILVKKAEYLGLNTQHSRKKLGMAECACNPSAVEAETGGSLEFTGQPASPNSRTPGSVNNSVSKTDVETDQGRHPVLTNVLCTCVDNCAHPCKHHPFISWTEMCPKFLWVELCGDGGFLFKYSSGADKTAQWVMAFATQVPQPELNSQNLCKGRRREPVPGSWPLTSRSTQSTCTHPFPSTINESKAKSFLNTWQNRETFDSGKCSKPRMAGCQKEEGPCMDLRASSSALSSLLKISEVLYQI